MRKRRILGVLTVLLLLCGCRAERSPKTIEDLVYQRGREEAAYTIYLPEEQCFVPYYVLGDYDSQCVLLVRKYLLDEPLAYASDAQSDACYPGSVPDDFLQHEYPKRFSEELLQSICDVEIQITTKETLYTGSPTTEVIRRKFFLLSNSEVFDNKSGVLATESGYQSFFDEQEHRIGLHEDGTVDIWWLRTPDSWYDTLVCTVDEHGSLGIGAISSVDGVYANGIRPACCIQKSAPIIGIEGRYYLAEFSETE